MRPDDKRVWYSNNLRCEDCAPNCCVCGRPCCVWNAAEQVLGDDLASEKEKQRALKLMQKLQRVLPVGEEPRTHVLCSSPGGCGLYACPYCAGRCPTTMCRDIQCLVSSACPFPLYLSVLFLTSFRIARRIRGGLATGTLLTKRATEGSLSLRSGGSSSTSYANETS